MPEQAQRRAPIAPPEEKSADASRAFEDVSHIVVSPEEPEDKNNAEIRSRMDNPEASAEDANSVADTIRYAAIGTMTPLSPKP